MPRWWQVGGTAKGVLPHGVARPTSQEEAWTGKGWAHISLTSESKGLCCSVLAAGGPLPLHHLPRAKATCCWGGAGSSRPAMATLTHGQRLGHHLSYSHTDTNLCCALSTHRSWPLLGWVCGANEREAPSAGNTGWCFSSWWFQCFRSIGLEAVGKNCPRLQRVAGVLFSWCILYLLCIHLGKPKLWKVSATTLTAPEQERCGAWAAVRLVRTTKWKKQRT